MCVRLVRIVGDQFNPANTNQIIAWGFFGGIPLAQQPGFGDFAQVGGNNLVGFALLNQAAFFKIQGLVAERLYRRQVVTNENDGSSTRRIVPHFAETLFLKFGIAHGQYFIHDHDFGVKVGRNGKAKPDIHTR